MNRISGQDLFTWIEFATQQARENNIDSKEIELIITELTSIDSLSYKLTDYKTQAQIETRISQTQLNQLWQQRIEQRCPIQYLIGECHWRNYSFTVTPDVLIPRPETELIIDLAQDIARQNSHIHQGKLLDLGTGSGAIAISLADTFPHSQVYAVDVSSQALQIAQQNAQKYHLHSRIKFAHGSWFEPIKTQKKAFSLIVSNPPYIPSSVVLKLQPEVVNHEPKIALDGGKDGLEDIRKIINLAPQYLQTHGFLILEMMAGQGKKVQQILTENGNYQRIEIIHDFAKLDRFVMAQLKTGIRY